MNCLYCRAWNSDDEHRCHRCGRRLHYAPAPAGPAPAYAHTALAEEQAPRPRHEARTEAPFPKTSSPQLVPGAGTNREAASTYQRPLFGTKDMGPVLPFNAFVAGEKPHARKTARPRVRRPALNNQQSLNFASAVMTPAVPRAAREGVIYCNARVASLEHRSLAAFIDFTVVAIALGAFVGTLYSFGGEVIFSKYSVPVYIAAAAILVLFYRLLWCLGNGDSPGMRAMQLHLVDLDGRRPDRQQRLLRLFSGWISILAAGLGLFWALADEESLTWHDHISRTFPASRE